MKEQFEIFKEIYKYIPEDKITRPYFEAANIVLYTDDEKFFLKGEESVKKAVDIIKKRIELRAEKKLLLDVEKTEKIIRKDVPEEAGITQFIFDHQRSVVIIEAIKPGLVIGKQASLLKEIKKKTFWTPSIKRTPAIRSRIIEDIRKVLYLNNEYRRNFLNDVGKRIYGGWKRERFKEWIRVSYLGGAKQVGRSMILLQTQESRILLDCGINPARTDEDMYPFFDAPEFNINDLDAVIVTHAHLDHSGLVPYLFRYGYKNPIYVTAPTRDIMALLQLDFIKVMEMQGKKAPYGSDEIKEMVKHTITLDYEEVSDITPDIRITLYNAGHILGSSMIHMHVGNGLHNVLYTGDFKFLRTQLLEGATLRFPRLETMMIESTYGGKDNILKPRKEAEKELISIIENTLRNGGKVLIPVLGCGRAQEVMLILENAFQYGNFNDIKGFTIYLDGMLWDITAIHTTYPEFINRTIRNRIFHKDKNPFLNPIFKRVGSRKERDQVIEESGPCVILATSGMLVGGSSVEYFKHLCDNPKNSLIFVSYQAEGSLGRMIQQGRKEINFGTGTKPELYEVKMSINTIDSLTGHAGRKELLNFIYRCNPRAQRVLVNHGESSRCCDLASTIRRYYKIEVNVPRNLDSLRLK